MAEDWDAICRSLSMTEIIRLQSLLSLALRQRFERKMALAFSDIVGSTRYFATFGDEAGRRLQQRHFDLLQEALRSGRGRIVDTAGDGAFLCFPTVDDAARSTVAFLRLNSAANGNSEREHQLAVRVGIHYGSVLTDGVQVTGDAVNTCARVTKSCSPGELRLTKDAFHACTDPRYRLNCRRLPPASLDGIDAPADLLVLDWRDRAIFPTRVRLDNDDVVALPDKDVISFGRLRDAEGGVPANDIVLQCADETRTKCISRWHFELRRRADGFVIRAIGNAPTEVNGRVLAKGEESPIRPGDTVRVSSVLTLSFESPQSDSQATLAGTLL